MIEFCKVGKCTHVRLLGYGIKYVLTDLYSVFEWHVLQRAVGHLVARIDNKCRGVS